MHGRLQIHISHILLLSCVHATSFLDGIRCGKTIKDLFDKAKDPDRLVVGIVDQSTEDDLYCLEAYCKEMGKVVFSSVRTIVRFWIVNATSDQTIVFATKKGTTFTKRNLFERKQQQLLQSQSVTNVLVSIRFESCLFTMLLPRDPSGRGV